MAKTRDLRAAIQQRAGVRPADPAPTAVDQVPGNRQASRIGKVTINAYFRKPVRDQLKMLALQQERTLQGLLGEALNELFAKHGLPEIADTD